MEAAAAGLPAPPSFREAVTGAQVAVIAEIKRQSPSKGVINAGLSAAVRAAEYAAGGAAALSVLTEPSRFGGSLDDLREAKAAVGIPLLRKDFITHRVQLLEARVAGASAVLLIARALRPEALTALARDARALGLDVLVETRDEAELARAVAIPDAVIGVNNRDLETLVIDAAVGERLIPLVPAGRLAVYESGVRDLADVERAALAGADAVLVGSVLSAAADPVQAVRRLAQVARRPRG
jgi:indole-3-glycerol phosphate synthase